MTFPFLRAAARHCNDSGAIGRGIHVSEIDRRTIKAHVPLCKAPPESGVRRYSIYRI